MATKKSKTKKEASPSAQLSLFDRGLVAPAQIVRRRWEFVAKPEPEILPPDYSPPHTTVVNPTRLNDAQSDPLQPAAFERATYELYLKSRVETRIATKGTATLVVCLLLAAVLGVQVQEALFGLVKFGSLPRDVLVGVLGWATLLSTCFTLFKAAYTAQKKRQCGLFYQRVLRFSDTFLARISAPILSVAYVCSLIGCIALTLIVARHEMGTLIWFIIRGILNMVLIGPWATDTVPAF